MRILPFFVYTCLDYLFRFSRFYITIPGLLSLDNAVRITYSSFRHAFCRVYLSKTIVIIWALRSCYPESGQSWNPTGWRPCFFEARKYKRFTSISIFISLERLWLSCYKYHTIAGLSRKRPKPGNWSMCRLGVNKRSVDKRPWFREADLENLAQQDPKTVNNFRLSSCRLG